VITVRVGYERTINRLPWIDVEVASFAVQPSVRDPEEIFSCPAHLYLKVVGRGVSLSAVEDAENAR
jgi:hypothetical protein